MPLSPRWAVVLVLGPLGLGPGCGRTEMFAELGGSTGGSGGQPGTSTTSEGGEPPPDLPEITTTPGTSTGPLPSTESSSDTIDPDTSGPPPAECGNGILETGEECDPGAEMMGPSEACVPGCRFNVCGDGMVGPTEDCDDADGDDDDACHDDCTQTQIVQIALGGNHSCVRLDNGAVRCWGNGNNGRSGQGTPDNIGDDEPASAGTTAALPPADEIAAGLSHTCARQGGQVRCFGRSLEGQLGYAILEDIGDDEPAGAGGLVPIGGSATTLAFRAGSFHTCVVMDDGGMRCWGLADDGRLGVPGVTGSIGDDEFPDSLPPIELGAPVLQATTGVVHTCALLDTAQLHCWGSNASGQLGYGTPESIGDDETPLVAGPVPIGVPIQQVTAGFHHTCALTVTGEVYCWGRGNNGRLGYGNTAWIGVSDTPASVGPVPVGGAVTQIEAGNAHTCALLETAEVRCWGWGGQGQLGYGTPADIGDDELPADAGSVPVGGDVIRIAADGNHTCALLERGRLRCWGNGGDGRLGYGDTDTLGDDELPTERGDVPLLP